MYLLCYKCTIIIRNVYETQLSQQQRYLKGDTQK